MKRQKCEPLRWHRFINLSSLWFVILISLVFAWPLGAYGKDEEGKKWEARVRCWWIRAQKPSPQVLLKRPLRDALTSRLRVKALWATRPPLRSCSCGLTWHFHVWLCLAHAVRAPAFGRWSLLQSCLWAVAPSTLTVPRAAALHPLERGKHS